MAPEGDLNDERQWAKIDKMQDDITDMKVAIARIEERVGTNPNNDGFMGAITGKNSAFAMAVTSIIITIGSVLNGLFGAK